MPEKSLDQLGADFRKLEAQVAAAREKLENQDYEDCFTAEAKYSRLHAKYQKARQAFLSAGGVL